MGSTVVRLDGAWKFRTRGKGPWRAARVPGCVHTDLLAHKLIPDPFWGTNELSLEWIENTDFEYVRVFTLPRSMLQASRLELVADGLDTVASVSINGKHVADTENMFIGYRFDITRMARPGRNTIHIVFGSPTVYIKAHRHLNDSRQPNDPMGGCSVIRKEQCSFGWDWGPRFPTSGIFRSIRIEATPAVRVASVHIAQTLSAGSATLICAPVLDRPAPRGVRYRCSLSLAGVRVAVVDGTTLRVHNPRLWWPNGLGAQPLYELQIELLAGDTVVDTWRRRIGIRTIELDRHPDRWGESFQFRVNGVVVFAKGANWVPAHSFQASVTPPLYDELLTAAAEAHLNMVRVWGGGVYENDEFYDLCDQKGLMVWQDFMFACSRYPGARAFVASVRSEAEYNVQRLAHHACMALWCGNNEVEQMAKDIVARAPRRKAYDAVFNSLLPEVVATYNPETAYWPSSPHDPEGYEKRMGRNSDKGGDAHTWAVWHGRQRVPFFETEHYRFVSEYGMQSYASLETTATFARKDQTNIFGPEMENHQKCGTGNSLIFTYISQQYRFPRDFASLVYLSQVNQAYALKTALEHHRREMPRCMGSLYWQLNDCWPVASWASVEFGGHWKGAHYAVKRSCAPAIVSAKRVGTEEVYSINRQRNTVSGCELHTVCDSTAPVRATLRWTLYHLDGRRLLQGRKNVVLRYGESRLQKTLDLRGMLEKHGKETVYLHAYLAGQHGIVSQTTVLFTSTRFVALPREKLNPLVKRTGVRSFRLVFRAKTFQNYVTFHLRGGRYKASDNCFDLYPGLPHAVEITVDKPSTCAQLRKRLSVVSMADAC